MRLPFIFHYLNRVQAQYSPIINSPYSVKVQVLCIQEFIIIRGDFDGRRLYDIRAFCVVNYEVEYFRNCHEKYTACLTLSSTVRSH